MAKALRCDRCGKYYDKNHKVVETKGKKIPVSGAAFVNGGTHYTMHKDLCDDCLDQLAEFFNTVVIGPVGESVEDVTDD